MVDLLEVAAVQVGLVDLQFLVKEMRVVEVTQAEQPPEEMVAQEQQTQ